MLTTPFYNDCENNMKSNTKLNLIILGFLFVLVSIITTNLSYFTDISNNDSEYSDNSNLDNKNLRISAVAGKIHIAGNWTDAVGAGICTGLGTYSTPYIIKDLEIDGEDSGSCILIENSNAFFKIENCSLFNSGGTSWSDAQAGIELQNVRNGVLIDNNCSNNFVGILIKDSSYIQVSDNYAANNDEFGILIWNVNNGDIFSNTIRYNPQGLGLDESNRNTIFGNTFEYNMVGLAVAFHSNYNIISGNNIMHNDFGIQFHTSKCNTLTNNIFSDNGVDIDGTQEECESYRDGDGFPFSIELIGLIVILCIVMFIIMGGLVYRGRKVKPFKSEITPKKKEVETLREMKMKKDSLEKQDEKEVLPLEPIPIIKAEEESEQMVKKVISHPESQPEPTPSVIIKSKTKDKELIESIEPSSPIEIREKKPVQKGLIESQDSSILETPIEKPTTDSLIIEDTKITKVKRDIPEPLKRFCSFCGYGNELNKTYCHQCGQKLAK